MDAFWDSILSVGKGTLAYILGLGIVCGFIFSVFYVFRIFFVPIEYPWEE